LTVCGRFSLTFLYITDGCLFFLADGQLVDILVLLEGGLVALADAPSLTECNATSAFLWRQALDYGATVAAALVDSVDSTNPHKKKPAAQHQTTPTPGKALGLRRFLARRSTTRCCP
jgi:hypothetical protein